MRIELKGVSKETATQVNLFDTSILLPTPIGASERSLTLLK